jgi:hypothetical protein
MPTHHARIRAALVLALTLAGCGDNLHELAVDNAPPIVVITGGPTGTTSDPAPTFTFSVTEGILPARCRIDTHAFQPCAESFTPDRPLADGDHSFVVQTDDGAGNSGSARRAFAVDTTPPEVEITGGPGSPTNDDTPTFTFTTSADTTRARCALDRRAVHRRGHRLRLRDAGAVPARRRLHGRGRPLGRRAAPVARR